MYSSKILLDSIGPNSSRLTTWELTYPRFVHAELMTHRVFSRCSASSRAIPVATMLKTIRENPAMPKFWGKNQKGMQASEELGEREKRMAERCWINAAQNATNFADFLATDLDVHKQLANRIVEPWMFIKVIVSATSFTNWFRLRKHKDAQPEIAWLAGNMYPKYMESKPQELYKGAWHLPLLHDKKQLEDEGHTVDELKAISAGRVARISYLTHDGIRDPKADIELGRRLSQNNPPHMSPLEHIAQALTWNDWDDLVREELKNSERNGGLFNPMMLGNLVGWRQYRKEVENEHGFDFDLKSLA